MKHRIAFCVGLTALGVVAATSAQAQVYVEPPPVAERPPVEPMVRPMFQPRLPPNEVLMIVRASGLRPLTQPAPRGTHYVLLASDNMGGQLRVVVNGNNGRIVNTAPAYDSRFAYQPVRPRGLVPMPPPQHGAAPPSSYSAAPNSELKDAPPPARTARATPPQAPVAPPQNSRLASAPDGAAAPAARPTPTPLPRPRPAVASNETTPPATAAPAAAPQAAPRETSPEADQPAAAPAAPASTPARPATETQMVPVAPLD